MFGQKSGFPVVGLLALTAVSACGPRDEAGNTGSQEAATTAGSTAAVATAQDTLPDVVLTGLTSRFPGAQIDNWAREEENGEEIYDFEFRQDGQQREADVAADGSIRNWEELIPTADAPLDAMNAAQAEYPGATIRGVMRVMNVQDGQDVLEGYEIDLVTDEGTSAEVTVAPDGTILEDSSGDPPPGTGAPE